MTQQPGQGAGQFGPQGPGGPQGPIPPQGSPGPHPYGSSPTPPPQYGAPQPPWQPPYGSQPPTYGGPPGGAGQPGYASQPQFTPPQQPYGAPQGPPQAPGAWRPHAGLPPAPPKTSKTGLIVAVIALAVVLVGGAGLWLALRPKPIGPGASTSVYTTTGASQASTTAATKATTATTAATKATTSAKTSSGDASCSGATIVSDAYSATVPKGWECSSPSGTPMITDAKFDTVMVMVITATTDAAKVCASLSAAGTLTELPDTQWGGKAAKTADLASGNTKMHVRCVAVSGAVYYLMAVPISGSYAEIMAGVDGLTSAWTWK